MATIYHEFFVDAPPDFVWQAIRDVGAVHTRLARGFVAAATLDGDERTVTFANGFVVREKIVSIDDDLRRLAYCAVGGRATHHNASFQVFADGERSRVLWVTDLLPEEVRPPVASLVTNGAEAIQRTVAEDWSAA